MSKYDLELDLIEEAIKRIGTDLNKSLENGTVRDAMLMRFQVISENVDKLPREIIIKYNKINWEKFHAYRNIVSRSYDKVLTGVIMELINELPNLKGVLAKIREELK